MKQRLQFFTSWLLVLLFCGLSHLALAQNGTLTGRLADGNGAPVSFANVVLLKSADNSFVAGVITDSTGRFTIPAPATGSYVLRLTAIGFTETRTALFDVTGADFSKNFESVIMKATARPCRK
jgi:hypothetical protein